MHFPQSVRGRVSAGWLTLVAVVLLLSAALWWWQSHRQTGNQGAAAQSSPAANSREGDRRGIPGAGGGTGQPVSVGVVDRRDMRMLVSAIGTLNARATAVVRSKVSGELQKLYFNEGDEVKAGQLLADIDPRSFQAALGQVQGSLQRDQAQLKNAQLDLQRYRALLVQDSIASQQVDTQAALVHQLQGTVAADQGQVDAAKLQLSYTKITAPIAGRLGLRQADLGNVVNPSDINGLVTITQVRPIDAVFSLPEAHVSTLALQLAKGKELPVELWDREQKQLLGKGRLNAVDNAIDTTTGTVKAKAAFANAEGSLFANQFVNVKLQANKLEQVLTVPATAVQNDYVYLVQADHTVTQRTITVGLTDGDRVSVQGNLQPGDQVVTDGIDRLREGSQVTVVDAGKAQQLDQAVQDAASQPRGTRNLTPEQREQVVQMSPEDRKAFFQKLRAERGGKPGNGPADANDSKPASVSTAGSAGITDSGAASAAQPGTAEQSDTNSGPRGHTTSPSASDR